MRFKWIVSSKETMTVFKENTLRYKRGVLLSNRGRKVRALATWTRRLLLTLLAHYRTWVYIRFSAYTSPEL